MNLLIDPLPEQVEIGGQWYEIRTDFRVSILFELLMQDPEVDNEDKVAGALDLYYPKKPPLEYLKESIRQMLWFYRCGRSDKDPRLKAKIEGEEDEKEEGGERAYSFDFDEEYIYAAYLQQYGIDLADIEYLHWWKFRAMFKALDGDCEFVKIMAYRVTKVSKDMSKGEKEFLRKMKRIHALPVSEKEQQENDALVEALMNGGDLTEILGTENEKEG